MPIFDVIVIISGLYLFFIFMNVTTKDFLAAFVFKFVPFILSLFLLVSMMVKYDVGEMIQYSTPM